MSKRMWAWQRLVDLAMVVDGLIGVVTLGFVRPRLAYTAAVYCLGRSW